MVFGATHMNQRFPRNGCSSQKRQQRRQFGRPRHGGHVIGQRFRCEQLEERVVLATIAIAPTADGVTQDNGPNGTVDIVVTNQVELQTQNLSLANAELRSELEFDLSGVVISPSETITSVRLQVQTTAVLGNPELTIYGYTGDGMITAADHSETNTQIGFEQAPPLLAEFDLATSFVSGFVGSPDTLGVLLTTSLDSAVNIVSADSGVLSERPVLVIETELTSILDIDAIIAEVNGLVEDEVLNNGNGNALIAKLEGAAQKIVDGHNNTAINKLEAFNNQVAALINAGKLTAEEGLSLTDKANTVIASLEGDPLVAPSFLSRVGSDLGAALSQNDLQPVVEQAIAYWTSTGIESEKLSQLSDVAVTVADIPGPFLGFATENAIRIDSDAAGYGWHIAGSSLSGGIDLLTAVKHEFGHVLGFDHDDNDDVMSARLSARVYDVPRIDVSSSDALSGVSRMSAGLGLPGAAADRVRTLAIQAITDQPYLVTTKNHDASNLMTRRSRVVGRERTVDKNTHGDFMAVSDENELHKFFEILGRSQDK